MLGLCSLIGIREGLFDAIYNRFISRKAVYPEVSNSFMAETCCRSLCISVPPFPLG